MLPVNGFKNSLKILLALAGRENLVVKHFDAKTAFLNGDLNEAIYMEQPEEYKQEGQQRMVCRLKKGLYGLKQAAKLWNEKLSDILSAYKFLQSKVDPCLFIKVADDKTIFIIIHVDDFLIVSKNVNEIDETATHLKTKFELIDLGLLKKYLGIEIRKNIDGFHCMKQTNYIDNIINKFGLQDAKPSGIPLDTGYLKIRKSQPAMNNSERYQQLIGALLYVAVNTRPDITASVTILSQFNKNPSSTDWTELKRIVRYLKGTRCHELILGRQDKEEGIIGYADADWAENRNDRKSNSGYIFEFLGATISWGCRKQACVALSSTESEYIALTEACQEALWIQKLLQDILPTKPEVLIWEDNQSCLKMIQDKKFSNRTKHIDTKFHFIKDLNNKQEISFKYCCTEEMKADMLTKPLSKIRLQFLSQKCGLRLE